MASKIETAEELLERYCKEILDDSPKFDDALKNLISMCSASAKSTNKNDFATILEIAKIISKSYNSHSLLDLGEWTSINIQSEQSSVERLEQIARYKAALYIRVKMINSNVKFSKGLGLTYIRWTLLWPNLKENILKSFDNSDKILSRRVCEYFMLLLDLTISGKMLYTTIY